MLSWRACAGNGGYGRLGHSVQKDEFTPKLVDALRGRMPVDKNSPVSPQRWLIHLSSLLHATRTLHCLLCQVPHPLQGRTSGTW